MEGLPDERVAGKEHDDECHDDADEGWMGNVVSYCTVDVATWACPTCPAERRQQGCTINDTDWINGWGNADPLGLQAVCFVHACTDAQ